MIKKAQSEHIKCKVKKRADGIMGSKKVKIIFVILWMFSLVFSVSFGVLRFILPEDTSSLPAYPCVSYADVTEAVADDLGGTVSNVKAKLFGLVTLKEIKLRNYEGVSLIPAGTPIGVKLLGNGVSVVGMADVASGGKSICPAKDAGIQEKDIILKVNGTPVKNAALLSTLIEASGGKSVTLLCKRGEEERSFTLTPVKADSDGKYKSGMWVKDASAGIGTVTFINPKTGEFGALGHGITDKETGSLSDGSRGVVTDCVVTGIVKGQKGTPGELRGYLKSNKRGALTQNTECGVFGVLTNFEGKAIPIATSKEVHAGKAVLRTALDGTEAVDYEIEIKDLGKSTTKCFTITVTDPRLLEKTGGIVQGMSGSPIIQNGKLVGAVTHVMINDPTVGYGIFIENMLNAAQMPMAKAS